jgi:hypothetical protein
VLTGFAAGGGIGASVVGISALLENVLPVVITFWLSAQIRNRGRTEQVLRRLHLFATLTLVAVLVLFVSQFFFVPKFSEADGSCGASSSVLSSPLSSGCRCKRSSRLDF